MGYRVKITDGMRAYQIAQETGIPVTTVRCIMRRLDDSRITDILQGRDVTITGLVSLHLLENVTEDGVKTIVRSKVSDTLRQAIRDKVKSDGFQRQENDVQEKDEIGIQQTPSVGIVNVPEFEENDDLMSITDFTNTLNESDSDDRSDA